MVAQYGLLVFAIGDPLAAVERYVGELGCRQLALCAHFGDRTDESACELCDVCRDPEAVHEAMDARPNKPSGPVLGDEERERIVLALGRLEREGPIHFRAPSKIFWRKFWMRRII